MTSLFGKLGLKLGVAVIPAMALASFFHVTGNPLVYVTYDVLDGQILYVFAKFFALLALSTLWVQLLSGIVGPQRMARFGIRVRHELLGMLTTAFVALHVTCFVSAVSLRAGHFAGNLFVPNFSDYYSTRLSLGLAALILLLVGVLARLMRNPYRRVWIHRLTYCSFALGMWHAVSVGTEIKMPPLAYTLVIIPVALLGAIAWRILRLRQQAA